MNFFENYHFFSGAFIQGYIRMVLKSVKSHVILKKYFHLPSSVTKIY